MKNIKFIFIGNSESIQEVGHYPEKNVDAWLTDCNRIFEKCSNPQVKRFDQRTRIVGTDGVYYFTISVKNFFYLILASSNCTEQEVFHLIDEVQKENIPLLVDGKTTKLNPMGKQSLKTIIEQFNQTDKIQDIQVELKETKDIVNQNLKEIVKNVDNVKDLEDRALKIKNTSVEYKKNAGELKCVTCWQNCKWTIIIVLLVIGILLAIILPLTIKSSSDSSGNNSNSSNTNSTTPKM